MNKNQIIKKYNSFDVFKLIMAIVVIAIHTRPLENCSIMIVNNIYKIITFWAVPFFFITTGFLLANKMEYPYSDEASLKRMKNYILRTVKLYIFWSIIYFPLAVLEYVKNDISLQRSILLYIRGLFLVGEHYNSYILWYLLSTIYGLSIIYILLSKKVSFKKILMISTGIMVLSIFLDNIVEYSENLQGLFKLFVTLVENSIFNGRILRGIFYIPLGMLLNQIDIKPKVNKVFLILGSIIAFFSKNNIIFTISSIVSIVGVFNIIKNINLKDHDRYIIYRKISTYTFFLHMYVWTIYYAIRYGEKTFGIDSFIYTTVITILISYVWIKLKNRYSM